MSYMPKKAVDEVMVSGTDPGLTAGYELWYDTSAPDPSALNFVSKAGDTMSGPLVLPGNPTLALQAAPKQYIDSLADPLQIALFTQVFGG